MQYKYPHLCAPITLGRTIFRNRMFSAPMGGTDITNDGCIGPKSTAFYELRAKGGAAAVTVSECMVHPQTDGSHAYHLDESILNSLACATYTADAIRRHGAIASLELSHSGMYSGTYMTDKNKQHGICAGRRARGLGTCSNPPGKTENRPAGTVWILLHCHRREFHRTLDGIHGMKSRTRKPLCFVAALPSTSAHPQAGTSWAGGRTPTPPPPAC